MSAPAPEHLFGILGKPLAQSLSPALHTWAFARTGFAGAYCAWEKGAEELPEFFRAVRCLPIAGLSVTIPHKQAVLPFLDGLTPRAGALGAVNTIFWRENRLMGENTDADGFLAALSRHKGALPPSALVLGAGGACRAALAGLRELGFARVYVAARKLNKAALLAHDFGCLAVPWEERERVLSSLDSCLIVNATPLGMRGADVGASPLSEDALAALARRAGKGNAPSLVYDLVYSPRQTRLLRMAEEQGLGTVDGLAFFVAQGLMQFRIWTGLSPSFEAAFALAAQELEKR